MSTLNLTDEMFRFFRTHCSDRIVELCTQKLNVNVVNYNRWDITDYINNYENIPILDKMNFIVCYIQNNGSIYYNETEFTKMTLSYLMTELVLKQIISQEQEADILMPWIDCTHGEPFFE